MEEGKRLAGICEREKRGSIEEAKLG